MTISQHQTRLRLLGIVLLLAGFGAGGFLYWRSLHTDAETDEILRAQEASKSYDLAMQKNVGPVGLLLSRWGDQLGSPRGVAVEVTLAGIVAAGGCFALAARPPHE